MWYTYICNRIILTCKKEWNLANCNNMDRSGEYYAKWNNPGRGRQILYNFTYSESISHLDMSNSLRAHGLSMEFSRKEYWSGIPFSSPGDLLNTGIELGSRACRQVLYHLSYPKWNLKETKQMNKHNTT